MRAFVQSGWAGRLRVHVSGRGLFDACARTDYWLQRGARRRTTHVCVIALEVQTYIPDHLHALLDAT